MNALREFRDLTIKTRVSKSSHVFSKIELNTYVTITSVVFRDMPCLTMYNMYRA